MSDANQNQGDGTGSEGKPAEGKPAEGAPLAKPAEGSLTIEKVTEFVLPPSGDPAVDVANKFLVNNGIQPGSAEWEALQKGDFGPAKAALAAKGVKGGTEYVAILEDRQVKAAAAEKAAREETLAAVHAAAGGADNWKAVTAWVAENATESELTAVNAALKGGTFMAKVMAEGLAARYAKANGPAPAVPALPDVRGGGAPSNGALSALEFREESQKLYGKLGARMEGSQEYAALRARRAAGMAQGR